MKLFISPLILLLTIMSVVSSCNDKEQLMQGSHLVPRNGKIVRIYCKDEKCHDKQEWHFSIKETADLDDDGYLEFAVFPFSPGSAIWGTARIFSLKEKIEFWGEGRYQFEGDTFVQLGCMRCSKFNPEECKKCH